ncbi:MAG: hypothetical protein ACOC1F_01765 [Myxococcota bacterium]
MTPRAARLLLRLAVLIGTAGWPSGCSLRPQPEPPPVEPGPDIDPDLLSVVPTMPAAMHSGTIEGARGAVPAGATVRAYNLHTALPPFETTVASDGSFTLSIEMVEGDEVRLQAIVDDERSEPLDLIVGAPNTKPVLASRALSDCLSIAPATQLDLGSLAGGQSIVRPVVIANGCAFEISVDRAQMRRPVEGLTVDVPTALPFSVSAGESASLHLRYDAPVGVDGEAEDVLLIQVDAPQRDRRPVTVFARVAP